MGNPVSVTDTSFEAEVLKNDLVVITDFWAEWCGPCRAIAPTLEEIAAEFDGRVKVAKLDIDANSNTTSAYGVLSIPTLLIFKNGQVVGKLVGVVQKSAIVDAISPYLIPE